MEMDCKELCSRVGIFEGNAHFWKFSGYFPEVPGSVPGGEASRGMRMRPAVVDSKGSPSSRQRSTVRGLTLYFSAN